MYFVPEKIFLGYHFILYQYLLSKNKQLGKLQQNNGEMYMPGEIMWIWENAFGFKSKKPWKGHWEMTSELAKEQCLSQSPLIPCVPVCYMSVVIMSSNFFLKGWCNPLFLDTFTRRFSVNKLSSGFSATGKERQHRNFRNLFLHFEFVLHICFYMYRSFK